MLPGLGDMELRRHTCTLSAPVLSSVVCLAPLIEADRSTRQSTYLVQSALYPDDQRTVQFKRTFFDRFPYPIIEIFVVNRGHSCRCFCKTSAMRLEPS
jgi:hypothetical protein